MSGFKKATKAKAKLRAAIFSPSGGGKSFTSLRIATGMIQAGVPGRIGAIDTENGTLSKYSDRFDFDVCDLEDYTIEGYMAAMKDAAKAGYGILIIDSGSHAWQELLEEVDKLAMTKYSGNSFSAWSEGAPKQRKLVNAILTYPGHVIWTMRSKTEWLTDKDKNGKMRPVRVGLAPEQGKGIEFEFDILIEMNVDHVARIIKDRSGKFQDKIINKPDEEFGAELLAWLNDGGEEAKATRDQIFSIAKLCNDSGLHNGKIIAVLSHIIKRQIESSKDLTQTEATACITTLNNPELIIQTLNELNINPESSPHSNPNPVTDPTANIGDDSGNIQDPNDSHYDPFPDTETDPQSSMFPPKQHATDVH